MLELCYYSAPVDVGCRSDMNWPSLISYLRWLLTNFIYSEQWLRSLRTWAFSVYERLVFDSASILASSSDWMSVATDIRWVERMAEGGWFAETSAIRLSTLMYSERRSDSVGSKPAVISSASFSKSMWVLGALMTSLIRSLILLELELSASCSSFSTRAYLSIDLAWRAVKSLSSFLIIWDLSALLDYLLFYRYSFLLLNANSHSDLLSSAL